MSKRKALLFFLASIYVIWILGSIYFVTSGLYKVLAQLKAAFLIGGIFLVSSSVFITIKGFTDERLRFKERLVVILGGGVSSGLVGFACILYALSPAFLPENFPYPLVIASFFIFQLAVIFAALSLKERYRIDA